MNDKQRETIAERYWKAEDKLRAIHAKSVVARSSAELEVMLIKQQDEIAFLLGANYFHKQDRVPE
jgi:hypothetical protein